MTRALDTIIVNVLAGLIWLLCVSCVAAVAAFALAFSIVFGAGHD